MLQRFSHATGSTRFQRRKNNHRLSHQRLLGLVRHDIVCIAAKCESIRAVQVNNGKGFPTVQMEKNAFLNQKELDDWVFRPPKRVKPKLLAFLTVLVALSVSLQGIIMVV